MIYQFANWNWEIPRSDPNYCKTWAIRRPNDGRSDAVVIESPWVGPRNGILALIARNQDYTKAKGWELLRMDFGGVTANPMPYFILYNKYTGTLRTFFYLNNQGGTYTTGATVTMGHSSANGSRNPGVLAMSRETLLTPEAYTAATDANDEIVTYVTKMTDQEGWIVADFTIGFDPNIGSSAYYGTALQFKVQGVVTNNINLKGEFNFKTSQDDGISFAGKDSQTQKTGSGPTASERKFLANSKKVFGVVDDITKFVDKFAAKATKTAKNTAAVSPSASDAASKIAAIATADKTSPSVFKKVLNVLGATGTALGIIGNVVGLLWPEEKAPAVAPPFTPTVSNGSIILTGSITTTYPLYSITVQTPGAQHFNDGKSQTYYNCALGLFSIKNTPRVNSATWRYTYDTAPYEDYYVELFYDRTSLQVANNLVATYNEAAGLKLVSAQAAIVVEQKREDVYADPYMRQQIASGEIVIDVDNDTTVMYQTPFIDLGNFRNQAITVASNYALSELSYKPNYYTSPYKVSVRIKAILQRKNATLDEAPIYYVQDYAITDQGPSAGVYNPRVNNTPFWTGNPIEPAFSNLLSGLAQNAPGQFLSDYTLPAGTYSSPLVVSAAKDILFPGTNPAGSSATFDHPGNGTSYLLSNTGISLGEGFSVRAGTNFVATTPLQGWKQGGQALVESNGPNQCPYNPDAYRILAAAPLQQALTGLAIYPNPTQGEFSITAKSYVGGTLTIYDGLGKQVEKIDLSFLGEHTYRVNLTGHAPGLYIVRMRTGQTTVSQKLLLQ
ncbi:T9SS type A sorting domain-containing protein [Hymenobacter cellulosivorans]|uniref:T9SS type A sorting domain-containing protein n=1 Tax=Hymenobacter cellulosivorans TaxID=2932249 RepID=A0ABY4F7N2_9BACT|nr:T9SS type A sorting domain-containing protein [Hymenobacter cellulosivorans]UOQ52528.1 T9SS type A sorting domain-containing protein [Hymenobacter cellulosivorans]